eukprot:9310882-Lingulodinium_polyedra.AAC.1
MQQKHSGYVPWHTISRSQGSTFAFGRSKVQGHAPEPVARAPRSPATIVQDPRKRWAHARACEG